VKSDRPRGLGRRGPRGSRFRRLQVRLLFWFLGAIVLAIAASIGTTLLTAGDQGETPSRVVSRHVQHRLAKSWDDPVATERYVAELRETTGLDLQVRRDTKPFANQRGRPPGGMVFEDGVAYFPVVRNGQVVGALELRTTAPRPRLWRVGVALLAALLVLGAVARRVSKRLARPLEHLAVTAERFGSGDLAARTGIEKMPRRWMAEEVRDVATAFDGMADRIARVVTEQRELLAAISHELRSPLGRARVALEIARERAEQDPAAARPLEEVDEQLVEIDAILGDLLASARAGLADLRLETTEIVPWLRARIASETDGPIELVASSDAAAATASIDSALLGRALHNLFTNARAHGHPKDAPLVVTASVVEVGGAKRVRVAVRDRGPGFSPDVLPRAFEAFVMGGDRARSPGARAQRADNDDGRPRGMGLGLALVRRIVEAHGGSASAKNLDGGGAEVGFEIPLAETAGA
jgi:signal transduction histidine kinase